MKLLTLEDSQALFDFEGRNKSWFESWVPPRPASYFDQETFPDMLTQLVLGMSQATYLMFVRYRGDDIVGRFNFSDIDGEQAEVGYRVCRNHLGQGIGAEGLSYLREFALKELRLKRLVARVASDNIASQKVLLRHSFVEHPTFRESTELNGRVILLTKFLLTL